MPRSGPLEIDPSAGCAQLGNRGDGRAASDNRFPPALAGALVVGALLLSGCTGAGSSGTAAPAVAMVAEDPSQTPKPTTHAIGNKPIPIIVNDEPITAYDIDQRVRLMHLGGGKGSTQQAADDLINETLELIEAERQGVKILDGQVERAFASIAGNLKMTPAQLTAALKGQGIEASTLKKKFRAQIAWQKLVQMRTQAKASVKTEDVTAALLQKGDPNALTMTEYVLQQIVFVVPAGSPANLFQQRRQEAEAFRQRYLGCDQALDQAKLLRGVVVKDIGRRDTSQLQGPVGDQIRKTPAGKTASPSQIDEGIEVVAVCSTRNIQSTSGARAEVENQLYLKQADDLGKDYLKELRDRAIIEYR